MHGQRRSDFRLGIRKSVSKKMGFKANSIWLFLSLLLKRTIFHKLLKNPYNNGFFFGYSHFNTSKRRGCQKWHGMLTVEGAWIKYLWEISCKKKVWGCTYVLNLGWYHFFLLKNLSKFGIKIFIQPPSLYLLLFPQLKNTKNIDTQKFWTNSRKNKLCTIIFSLVYTDTQMFTHA